MALSGTEILYVLGVQTSGQPSSVTEQTTTQAIANLAALAGTGPVSVTGTLATATPSTTRELIAQANLTYAGTVTVASGAGSIAGSRSVVQAATGTTLGDGFYYGAQGKFILNGGTLAETSAARYTGVLAQLDVSSGTMTSGQLSALWADMGATAVGAFAPETNIVRASNTTAQAVNAIVYGYGKASYGFDLSSNGAAWLSTTGTAGTTTAKGWIKVNINGSVRYIPLTDAVS